MWRIVREPESPKQQRIRLRLSKNTFCSGRDLRFSVLGCVGFRAPSGLVLRSGSGTRMCFEGILTTIDLVVKQEGIGPASMSAVCTQSVFLHKRCKATGV